MRSFRPATSRVFSTSAELASKCSEYTMWSWSAQKVVKPLSMVKAEGIYFWDADGKKYTDFNAQLMCSNIGHQHPKVIEAIQKQASELCYAGPHMATRVRSEIGEILARHTPGDLKKFFFTLGGAESNEHAVKFARYYTGRNKIITRHRAYHGATFGAVTLTGDPRRWASEPGMSGVVRVFDPDRYRSRQLIPGESEEQFTARHLAEIEDVIQYEGAQNVAAIFIETVTGTNGILVPPKGYLQGLRKICDKTGILLVCDEVMCGMGRTGEWYAVDHWGVVPDILTTAKGLTSAYLPLGCVMLSKKIAEAFDQKVYYGGLTYNGHPMCLAAAVATLKVLEDEDIVGNSKRMGKVMEKCHAELKAKHPCVGDARNIGLFGCLELVKNRKTKEPMAPYNGTSPAMVEVGASMRQSGLYCFVSGNLVHTNPPLVINEAQLKEAFALIDKALDCADKYVEE